MQREPDPVALTARVGTSVGDTAAEQAARALGELARRGITVDNFSLGQPSLDEVFLALTGHDTQADSTTDSATDSTADSTEGEAAA